MTAASWPGYYFDGPGPHGFIYDKGTFTTIDLPGAFFGTNLTAINNRGEVAGYYDRQHLVLWLHRK